ncbi:MRPS33 [Auxenochlorella protothecoides x Auxenochlorella symbiontica]|uniref:Small ribosomal subunit protein mS33 n=1 Tax=Auxenochlorella protothecoides TaxID=3075 RepID=A0A1D2A2Y5_AUXPR
MALRALAQEAWTVGSALLRRSIHSSATTSCLHAARQVPALQSCAGLSTSSGRSLPGLTRGFAAQASYSDEEIREIEARIFGSHIGNGLPSGRKILKQKLVGEKLASYYPENVLRADPYMLNIQAERAKLKLDRLRRRGKAPPKKGAGKRSSKRK